MTVNQTFGEYEFDTATTDGSELVIRHQPTGSELRIDQGSLKIPDASDTLDGTFPGWDTSVSVGQGLGRIVLASFDLAADTDSDAWIRARVEDDTGTFQTAAEEAIPAGIITTALTISTTISVPAGRSYKFTRSGNAGVVENIVHYSTVDLGV